MTLINHRHSTKMQTMNDLNGPAACTIVFLITAISAAHAIAKYN